MWDLPRPGIEPVSWNGRGRIPALLSAKKWGHYRQKNSSQINLLSAFFWMHRVQHNIHEYAVVPCMGKTPMDEGMATHSSIFTWTKEPGELWSLGLKESDMTGVNEHTHMQICNYFRRTSEPRTQGKEKGFGYFKVWNQDYLQMLKLWKNSLYITQWPDHQKERQAYTDANHELFHLWINKAVNSVKQNRSSQEAQTENAEMPQTGFQLHREVILTHRQQISIGLHHHVLV